MSTEKPPSKTRTRALIEEVGKIKFNRTPTAISQDPKYLERLPMIAELYKDTEFWHGTGRYKYSDAGELEDILAGIIRNGGLVPHEDGWDRGRGTIHTISTAPSRMYARLYAGMYAPAATRISNELGSRELWGYYFLGTSAVVGMLEYRTNLAKARRGDDSNFFIPDIKRKTKQWTGRVSTQGHSLKDIFLYGTDIAENYPILIGIKKGAVKPTHGSKFINLHEKRAETPVTMGEFSHFEVPKNRVRETLEALQNAGYANVQVLPIEYGEEYCRKFTFRALTNGKPLG